MNRIALLSALSLLLLGTAITTHATETLDKRYYGNRIIVKMKPVEGDGKSQPAQLTPDKMSAMAEGKRYILRKLRRTGLGADIVQLSDKPTPGELEELAKTINARSDVEYAHVDYKRYPAAFSDGTPNDPLFEYQWYLQSSNDYPGATNIASTWSTVSGNSIVIAVIDTGFTKHEDFGFGSTGTVTPNMLNRNDFISSDDGQSDFSTAADGDGFDNDASDMGDRVSETEKLNNPVFADDPGCTPSDKSSWHGAKVAGVIAADPDNGVGMVGVAPNSILQVNRALGKCGGYISDIMDATLYSAGLPVPSINFDGANNVSTDIINLSLGGGGSCTATESEAIRKVIERGLVVVTAAGNDGGDANQSAPGNCTGTINVTANTKQGGQAIYSNTGSFVDIAAPGGSANDPSCDTDGNDVFDPGADGKNPTDNPECFTALVTTSHGYADIQETGETSWEDITNYNSVFDIGSQGTSFSAPIVSGIISLMLDANENLTPKDIYSILVETARPFPTSVTDGAACTTEACGAGIVDAAAAVAAAQSGSFTPRDFPTKSGGGGSGGGSGEPFFGATGKGGGGGAIAPLILLAVALLVGWRRTRH